MAQLAAGEYVYTFKGYDVREYAGGAKLPPCTQIVVTLQIDTPEAYNLVYDHLYLDITQEWKITNFFKSMGTNIQGASVKQCLDATKGKQGKCLLDLDNYTNKFGETIKANRVKAYLVA